MSKVLIVFAHPDPRSLTRQLVDVAVTTLEARGHQVTLTDLYGMGWNPVYDAADFPNRLDAERLKFVEESYHAFSTGTLPAEVRVEQQKMLAADALILQFPLWWFSMPAIMKGWIERVWACGLAYNYQGAGNRIRYGEGAFAGRRALVSVTVGGPALDYSPRGINGPIEELLFPLTHGTLFFPGMAVLPVHAVYGVSHITTDGVVTVKANWRTRITRLFDDEPTPFRAQNSGDYPNHHTLSDEVAPGESGLLAQIRTHG